MTEKKTTNSKSLFTRALYIFFIVIFLVKAESSLYAPIEHCYYSSPTEIELVVATETEYNLSLFKLDPPPKQGTDFTVARFDFSSIYKFTLFHYDNYVRRQLKSFKRAFSFHYKLTAILQKQNIWHQFSDDEALRLG